MNKKILIVGIVCLIAGIACIAGYIGYTAGRNGTSSSASLSAEEYTVPVQTYEPEEDPEPEKEPEAPEEEAEEPEEESAEEETAIDFEALQEINSDIYAWLEIPGTDINNAILQNAADDEYYLTHADDGSEDANGAIFTQATYNGLHFTDPCTLVYCHNTTGAAFDDLQAIYSDPETFASCSEAIVYTEDQELHYTVFAAVPYDNRHILYNYDFTSSRHYKFFLQSIYEVRALNANFDESIEISYDDTLMILSTCLKGDNTQRYLVLFRLDETTDG